MNCQLTSAFFVAWICLSSTAEEKVSDACHGQSHVNRSYNNLNCGSGLSVFVTEVRYYQWKYIQICPHQLSNDQVRASCCVHEDTTCSWTNHIQKTQFQELCMGKMKCRIHSPKPLPVAGLCFNATSYRFSSVQSIRYQCVLSGTIDTTSPGNGLNITTQSVSAELDSNNNQNDVGKIVGSVIGALVGCALIILAVVFFIRRAKSKRNVPGIHSANKQSTAPNHINSTVYADIDAISETPQQMSNNAREMDLQVFLTDGVSVEYSNVNKPRTNDNFMPFAHFQQTPEYSHIIGEPISLVTHNDHYDHTSGVSANQEASFHEPEYHVLNPTYDKLDKKNVRVTSVNDVDPYNILAKERI